MLESLKELDIQLFLFLNGLHSDFFDTIMWLASSKFIWVPLYAWFLWLLYKKHRKDFWIVVLTVILMIIISDQLCNLSKNGIMRLRPSNDPGLMHKVHILKEYRGGPYGFYSGHASNAFAVAIFVILALKSRHKYILPVGLAFALLVSYSRIYLGVHYPLDILTGVVMGSLIAWLMYKAMTTFISGKKRRTRQKEIPV